MNSQFKLPGGISPSQIPDNAPAYGPFGLVQDGDLGHAHGHGHENAIPQRTLYPSGAASFLQAEQIYGKQEQATLPQLPPATVTVTAPVSNTADAAAAAAAPVGTFFQFEMFPGSTGVNLAPLPADDSSPATQTGNFKPGSGKPAKANQPVSVACVECRSRHLKCDAASPICTRCAAEGRGCRYIQSRRGWKTAKRDNKERNKLKAAAQERIESFREAEMAPNSDDSSAAAPRCSLTSIGSVSVKQSPKDSQLTSSFIPSDASTASGSRPRTDSYTTGSSQSSPPGSTPPRSLIQTLGTGQLATNVRSNGDPELDKLLQTHAASPSFNTAQTSMPSPPPSGSLVQLYYAYFHSAHPIILPPAYLLEKYKQNAPGIAALRAVINWIGAHFSTRSPKDLLHEKAKNELFVKSPPKNGFTVQAITLYALVLHVNNVPEKSMHILDSAITMAIEIGMNDKSFAVTHGEGLPVLEESWRRTWWELYAIEAMLSAVHQMSTFRLFSVSADVPLPCEEVQYLHAHIPPPRSLQEFIDRDFAEQPIVYSSYAYRIDAVRTLGVVLAAGQDSEAAVELVESADTSLVNWGLSLPRQKNELVGLDGKVDEMLFQAHMIVNAASIYLHRARSNLAVSSFSDNSSCTPAQGYAINNPIRDPRYHTAKAIRAADTISRLITLPTPLIRHTPILTCMVTMAAVVHLSACSFILYGDQGRLSRERIRLGVGALKTLDEVWPVAGCVLESVKAAAREVFAIQRSISTPYASGFITEDDIMRFVDDDAPFEGLGETDYFGLPGLEWNGSEGLGPEVQAIV